MLVYGSLLLSALAHLMEQPMAAVFDLAQFAGHQDPVWHPAAFIGVHGGDSAATNCRA
jgi:hypothetical protein